MRPQEILGMVEEAAGTRMFEDRKDKAKKTMGKKEKRVQELTSLLDEEITPKLEKLRAEKRSYLQWQKACSELERIARVLRAWEWMEGQERVVKKEREVDEKKGGVERVKEGKKRSAREGEAAERDVEDVVKKRDAEMRKGGKLKKLEEEVGELGKSVVKIRTQAEIKEGTIKDEEGKVIGLERELQEVSFLRNVHAGILTVYAAAGRVAGGEEAASTRPHCLLRNSQGQTHRHPNDALDRRRAAPDSPDWPLLQQHEQYRRRIHGPAGGRACKDRTSERRGGTEQGEAGDEREGSQGAGGAVEAGGAGGGGEPAEGGGAEAGCGVVSAEGRAVRVECGKGGGRRREGERAQGGSEGVGRGMSGPCISGQWLTWLNFLATRQGQAGAWEAGF